MLTIKIQKSEWFNEQTGKFVDIKERVLNLEHSLISLSRWESKWNKPFLSKKQITLEEYRDYVGCMSLSPLGTTSLFGLTDQNLEDIKKYIDAPMTATTFSKTNTKPNNEVITAEILYYRMIVHNIPMECQKWHLNRLLTLIQIGRAHV